MNILHLCIYILYIYMWIYVYIFQYVCVCACNLFGWAPEKATGGYLNTVGTDVICR